MVLEKGASRLVRNQQGETAKEAVQTRAMELERPNRLFLDTMELLVAAEKGGDDDEEEEDQSSSTQERAEKEEKLDEETATIYF